MVSTTHALHGHSNNKLGPLYMMYVRCANPGGSGVATGVARGQSATPDSENLPKFGEKKEKSGKNGKKEEISGRKGKNREASFNLPHLTDRAGYATARGPIRTFCFISSSHRYRPQWFRLWL